jgi:hypothetical protein
MPSALSIIANGWQCFMVSSELVNEFLGMLNGNTSNPIQQTFKHPSVTYKTASYLKDAYKSMKRRARQQ